MIEFLSQEGPLWVPKFCNTVLLNRVVHILTFISGFIVVVDIYKVEIVKYLKGLNYKLKKIRLISIVNDIFKIKSLQKEITQVSFNHPSNIRQHSFFSYDYLSKIKKWESENPTETANWKTKIKSLKTQRDQIFKYKFISITFVCLTLWLVIKLYNTDIFLTFFSFLLLYIFFDYVFITLSLFSLILILFPFYLIARFCFYLSPHEKLLRLLFFIIGSFGLIISFLTT
jgi:hypothetical protein